MDMGFKYGLTVRDMKENGKEIKHMEEESFGMLMVMSLTENGLMIKLMDTECILM